MSKYMKQIEMVLKAMKPTDFGGVAHQVKFVEASSGACSATIKVGDEHTNLMGGMNAGFSASLIDIVSSAALLIHPNTGTRPAVSVNINLSYIKGAKTGDELIISSKTLRSGRNLAYIDAEIRNASTNDLLVQGQHTKYYLE